MTTGRINQVTILQAEPRSRVQRPPVTVATTRPSRKRAEVRCKPGGGGPLVPKTERSRPTGDRHHPREGVTVNCGHPIAPTEFPKAWSAATRLVRAPWWHTTTRLWHTPLEWRTPRTGHVKGIDGYRSRLTPRNLNEILAKGQSSTDLILTEALESISDFGQSFTPVRGLRW